MSISMKLKYCFVVILILLLTSCTHVYEGQVVGKRINIPSNRGQIQFFLSLVDKYNNATEVEVSSFDYYKADSNSVIAYNSRARNFVSKEANDATNFIVFLLIYLSTGLVVMRLVLIIDTFGDYILYSVLWPGVILAVICVAAKEVLDNKRELYKEIRLAKEKENEMAERIRRIGL